MVPCKKPSPRKGSTGAFKFSGVIYTSNINASLCELELLLKEALDSAGNRSQGLTQAVQVQLYQLHPQP